MSYRDDLAALSARHAALESEVAQKARELEQTTRLLEDARTRARLPVLDNIRVAAPCPAEWAEMTGDERVRHCGECRRDVYNLSGMTRDEAEALILGKAGRLCVRYYERADGTILLKGDCEVGVVRRRRRRRRNAVFAGAAAMLVGGAGVLGGRAERSAEIDPPESNPVKFERLGKYEGVGRPQPLSAAELPIDLEPRLMQGLMAINPEAEEAARSALEAAKSALDAAKLAVEAAKDASAAAKVADEAARSADEASRAAAKAVAKHPRYQ